MAESGHPINLAHFGDLITAVSSFGSAYKPSGPELQLTALKALRDTVKADVAALSEAKTGQDTVANSRRDLFAGLDTLARRIASSAAAAGATDAQRADIEETARKIKGERAGTRNEAPADPADPKSISVSQQSFINLASHLDGLIRTLQAIPRYAPNEDDLKTGTLQALHKDMEAANEAVSAAGIALGRARAARNRSMYGEHTGLVDMAARVKDYVFSSSDLGARNPDFIAIKGIAFTRLKQ